MTLTRGVYKKRKFKGHQHTIKLIGLDPETSTSSGLSQPLVRRRPKPTQPSSSKIILSAQSKSYSDYKGEDKNIIISLANLTDAFSKFAVCRYCRGELTLLEIEEKRNGLACRLSISCLKCDRVSKFWTSNECKPKTN